MNKNDLKKMINEAIADDANLESWFNDPNFKNWIRKVQADLYIRLKTGESVSEVQRDLDNISEFIRTGFIIQPYKVKNLLNN